MTWTNWGLWGCFDLKQWTGDSESCSNKVCCVNLDFIPHWGGWALRMGVMWASKQRNFLSLQFHSAVSLWNTLMLSEHKNWGPKPDRGETNQSPVWHEVEEYTKNCVSTQTRQKKWAYSFLHVSYYLVYWLVTMYVVFIGSWVCHLFSNLNWPLKIPSLVLCFQEQSEGSNQGLYFPPN